MIFLLRTFCLLGIVAATAVYALETRTVPTRPIELFIRTNNAVVDTKKASIACTLADTVVIPDAADDTNLWTLVTPGGDVWIVDVIEGVLDAGESKAVQDVEVVNKGDIRHLEITFPTSLGLFGSWQCQKTSQKGQFLRGRQELVDPEDPGAGVTDVRLGDDIVPVAYDIELIPILESGLSLGHLSLQFDVDATGVSSPEKRRSITLHTVKTGIDLDSVAVEHSIPGHNPDIVGHEYDIDRQWHVIHLKEPLQDGLTGYQVSMDFNSHLDRSIFGFYINEYTNQDGEQSQIGVTQFEDIYARKAFPCQDEPAKKATFKIRLGREKSMVAVSNSELVKTTDLALENSDLEYQLDEFDEMPRMSPYLVAFIVSDFVYTKGEAGSSIKVYHQKGQEHRAGFAARMANEAIKSIGEYADYEYVLPKLDLAAVPKFGTGAMENWGLPIFSESNLLFEEGTSSYVEKEAITNVICHELSHQWFGDLVTLDWWENLWLNEGLSTFVASVAMDKIDPAYETRERFVVDELQTVFKLDSLESALPMSNPVVNPANAIDNNRNSFSYSKASAILRMIEHIITPDLFQKGLQNYLREHALGNVNRNSLWDALNDVAVSGEKLPENVHLSEIMEPWATQPGYPLVSVDQSADNQITISQSRFYSEAEAEATGEMWTVPITLYYPGQEFDEVVHYLEDKTMTLATHKTPYIINHAQAGYYRVNYPKENWYSLIRTLKSDPKSIRTENRAQLIDDSYHLAMAGKLEISVYLDLIQYLDMEPYLVPLKAAFSNFEYLDRLFRHHPQQYEHFREFVSDLLKRQVSNSLFDIEGVKHIEILRRRLLLDWACLYDNQLCHIKTRKYFREWMTSVEDNDKPETIADNPIPADLRTLVYQDAVRTDTDEGSAFSFLFDRYSEATIESERQNIIYALGKARKVSLIDKLLLMTTDDSNKILDEDKSVIFRSIGSTTEGSIRQLEFLENTSNYGKFKNYYTSAFPSVVLDMLSGFLADAHSEEDIARIEDFIAAHADDLESIVQSIRGRFARVRKNMHWFESNKASVLKTIQDANLRSFIKVNKGSATVEVGEMASVECNIPRPKKVSNPYTCQWVTPTGSTLDMNNEGTLVDLNQNGKVVDYASLHRNLPKSCTLNIRVKAEHLGKWSCRFIQPNEFFYQGTFNLISNEDYYVKDVRLPRNNIPTNYMIELTPRFQEDPLDERIHGHMELYFDHLGALEGETDNLATRQQIYIHAKDIMIDDNSFGVYYDRPDTNAGFGVLGHEYDIERDFHIIHLYSVLDSDWVKHKLTFDFTSKLGKDLVGFYQSEYNDNETDEKKFLAVTQLEPTYARRAFPCMDEPDMKATFDLTIGVTDKYTATSNMPHKPGKPVPHPTLSNYYMYQFEQTEIMSTYLLAIMVSELVPREAEGSQPVFSIWHAPDQENNTQLAIEAGPLILNKYEEYFGVDFPLIKMDMAAIPDFGPGAMENWGLITYRDQLLLFDNSVSSRADEQRVVTVIAHELAHQWFGNLVTMKWWDDVWLNEGFASYMENLGVDFFNPKFESEDLSILTQVQFVMQIDAIRDSHALSNAVDNPDYDSQFDSISYQKGASLIRMIASMIGKTTFQNGITRYLQSKEYDNADQADLFEILTQVAHEEDTLDPKLSLGEIMAAWTNVPGYPVVQIGKDDRDYYVTQTRFFFDPDLYDGDETIADPSRAYVVPLKLAYPGEDSDKSAETRYCGQIYSTPIHVARKPFILNPEMTGYYRVNYDRDNWEDLVDLLNSRDYDSIDRLTRAQLIDDSMNLARAGQEPMNYETAFNLVNYLQQETDYIPLQSFLSNMLYLDHMYRLVDKDYEHLHKFVKNLLGQVYDKDVFDITAEDTYTKVLLKTEAISWMCWYGNTDCQARSDEIFDAWLATPSQPIPVDIKAQIYNDQIRRETSTQPGNKWDVLWKAYQTTNDAAEKAHLLTALGLSPVREVLDAYLWKTISPYSGIRTQDVRTVYRAVGAGYPGRDVQLAWIQDNYAEVKEYHGARFPSNLLEIMLPVLSDTHEETVIAAAEDLMRRHPDDFVPIENEIRQAMDSALLNVGWQKRNYDKVLELLQKDRPAINDEDEKSNGVDRLTGLPLLLLAITVAISLSFNIADSA